MHVITKVCVLFVWMHALTFVESKDCTLEEFKKSDQYDSNFDITVLADTYAPGRQVRVPCNVGYSGFFRLTCAEGGWEHRGTKCQPRSCGHPGDAQFAEFHLEEGDDFVFGSRVAYICHKGYQMVSRTNYRRCMAQGWDGVVPVCEAQQCPAIHVENNVQVFGDPEEATYGNVVRFSCKLSNETLKGPSELYCDENGAWSGEAPKCKGVKCEVPVIENGFVPGDIREYKENEVLHFECNQKYSRPERRPSKCTKVGQKAEFSPTPLCELTKCKLPTPERGTRFEPADKTVFSPGNKVRVTCEWRSWISNIHTTSEETTCKDDGQWSVRPVCQEVICSNPRDPLVYYWGVSYWQQKRLGDTAQYTCRRGYKKTDGVTQATCTRDGWSPNPLCQEIICERKYYDNADIAANSKAEYKYNEHVDYLCKNGYEQFTITCGENGWVGTSTCSVNPVCPKPVVEHGFAVGPYKGTFYYTCDDGFKLFKKGWWGEVKCNSAVGRLQCIANTTCGKAPVFPHGKVIQRTGEKAQSLRINCDEGYSAEITHLTCQEGKWHPKGSALKTICRSAHHCSPPPKVDNAVVLTAYKKEYSSGSGVTYQCRNKYIMEGESTIKCKDGEWENTDMKCIPYCDKLKDERHTMNFTADKDRYMDGDVIEFQCRIITDAAVEGNATCVNGKWNKTVECKAKPCPPLDYIPNANFEMINGDDFVYGTSVRYFCDQRYKLVGENDTRTCLMDGWTNSAPTCELITCEADVPHPSLTVDNLPQADGKMEIGHKLRFRCSDDHHLDGSEDIECLETGQWSAPYPTCLKACKVPEIPNNHKFTTRPTSNHLLRGQTLTFGCLLRGHFVQGNATIECLENGQWSGPIPTCGAPLGCDRPPYLPDGDIRGTVVYRYTHNDRVEYACQRYYTMEGESHKTCNNGEWTGEIRCIKPCTVDREAMTRHNIRFKYTRDNKLYSAHKDEIEFVCTRGRPVGGVRMRQMCLEGVMDLPTCQ